jgi:hypothetical protein
MTVQNDELAASRACHVELASGVVDAGGELKMKASVVCTPPQDCVGRVVEVRDGRGELVAAAVFVASSGEASETDWFAVGAPDDPGDYTWLAAVAFPDETPSEAVSPVTFTVRAHPVSVVVWDVPSAIATGETFCIHVGMKCSSACVLAGHAFDVLDASDAVVASGRLGPEVWQKTKGLYFAPVELRAPEEHGRQQWRVRVADSADGLPHAAASAAFGVIFVPPPDCLLAVQAIDRDTRQPVTGAQIVVHPYRTVADADGQAEIRVRKGEYTIFVSRRKYLPTKLPVAVTEDLRVTAELMLEPPHGRE